MDRGSDPRVSRFDSFCRGAKRRRSAALRLRADYSTMSFLPVNDSKPSGLRALPALSRITALSDGGGAASLGAPRPSPHLSRFGIAAQDDDGLVTARVRIAGAPVLIAAQDEHFL